MSVTFNSQRIDPNFAIHFHEVVEPPVSPTQATPSLTTCSKTVTTANRQKIEFTYWPEDKTVSAQILESNGRSIPIAPENLPKELSSIPSAESFLLYLNHSSALMTRLGDGGNRIHLDGRILGGISYEEALAALDRHLKEMANPYLLEDVLDRFQRLSVQEEILDSLPMMKFFDDLTLPDDTKRHLTTLFEKSEANINALKMGPEENFRQLRESIQKDFSLFYPPFFQLEEKKGSLTPALKLFFQLDGTKRLDNGDICSIKQSILDNDVEQLRKTVPRQYSSKGADLSKMNAELETTEYFDLDTLLAEAVRETPKAQNGLNIYWNEPPSFFIGKTLYLTDPTTFCSYNGKIIDAQNSDGNWVFTLQDHSEIHVTKNHEVQIVYKTIYGFWRALDKVFQTDSVLDIEPISTDPSPPLIQRGTYIFGGTVGPYKDFGKKCKRTILLDPSEPSKTLYSLKATYDGDSEKPTEVSIKKGTDKTKTYTTVDELNATLNILGREVREIEGIDTKNFGEKILIKNEVDENELKLACLQEIERERTQLRDDLRKEENRAVFDALLDDLVKQNFAKGSIALLTAQKPQLADRLKGVAQKYLKDLQQEIDPEQILRELLLDANYANLVADVIEENLHDDKKKNVVSISHTMGLLNAAFRHIHKLSGKELIIFMGNTGSGKSTSVNFLLKTRLKNIKNAVGDSVVEVDPEQGLRDDIPRIGQSIGNSETLYTQAYPLQDSPFMLTDCPGFKDTRGQKHELCTNLSIDRAIQGSGTIKSIVITVPIHSFLDEKGNAILELVETVKERFPRTFNPDSMKDSSHVFFLITKSQQSLPETVKKLEDGTRIQALFNSSQERLTELLKRQQDGAKDIDSEIEKTRSRSRIWQSLRSMQSNGQFDFIDIKNRLSRNRLLAKYSQAGNVDKSQYAPLMTGGAMRLKFGEYIELSTNTWTQHIFGQYLSSIPSSLQEIESELTHKKGGLEQYKQKKRDQQARALLLTENQRDLRNLIGQLEEAQASPETLAGPLKEELQKAVEQVNKDARERIQGEIDRIDNAIQTATDRETEVGNRVTLLQDKIANAEGRIKKLQEEIQNLEKGTSSVVLYEYSKKSDEELRVQTWKAGARQKRYDEFLPSQKDDFKDDLRVFKGKDYRGTIAALVFIEKEFKIVPTDPALKAAFAERNRGGQFEAKLEGRKFKLDLIRKASDTGQKVLYPFLFKYDGDGLPEVRITHTIPNTEFNSATVRNKNGEINLLKQQLVQDQGDLNGVGQVRGKLREKEEVTEELDQLKAQREEQQEQLEQLEKAAQEEKIGEMLQQKRAEDLTLSQEKLKAEDTNPIDNSIRVIEAEISSLAIKKKELERKKRNFAIIIKFQEETAKLLREFAGLIVYNGSKEVLRRNQTIEACEKYISLYDNRIDEIRALYMSDLETT